MDPHLNDKRRPTSDFDIQYRMPNSQNKIDIRYNSKEKINYKIKENSFQNSLQKQTNFEKINNNHCNKKVSNDRIRINSIQNKSKPIIQFPLSQKQINNKNNFNFAANIKFPPKMPSCKDIKILHNQFSNQLPHQILHQFTDQFPNKYPNRAPNQVPNQTPNQPPNKCTNDQFPNQNSNQPPNKFKNQTPRQIPDQNALNNQSQNNGLKNQSSVQYYVQKCLEGLNKFKQYFHSYSINDFEQFIAFYKSYVKLNLIHKQKVKQEVNKLKKYRQQQQIQNKPNWSIFTHQVLIVDSALYYSSDKHRLRATQILALYLFLFKPETRKLLLEILTGQGKSTTVACMAAILAIRGRYVDIITTSKILAQRDAQEKSLFFSLMGLKCSHNITSDDNKQIHQQISKPRKCYEKLNVVYGTPFFFQVDLLQTEYMRKGTRNNRPYDIVIIDEVDSMLLDEKSNQTTLASTYTGYFDLIEVLRIIWQSIITNTVIKDIKNQFHILIDRKNGSIIKAKGRLAIGQILRDIAKQFPNQIINIHKLKFIVESMQKWIQSALDAAFFKKENKHYVVENQTIVPVDFQNTGCYQRGVNWNFGLHQFLQMKHGLDVTIQSITSNYISNLGHFSRYRRIYGLTGTLGSGQSMKFLQKIYGVQMFEIPPFKKRILKIDPGFAMQNYKQWINQVSKRCQTMMQSGRAVLIICQSINAAQTFAEVLKIQNLNYKSLRVLTTGQQGHSDKVENLDIIVATNVAGRGTDFKPTKSLIQKGGLHVIITFMPPNLRVQMQARGRAGRNGAPGSSQLIIDLASYYKSIQKEMEKNHQDQQIDIDIKQVIKNVRDVREKELMKNDYIQVKRLRTLDMIFSMFCETTQKIEDYIQNPVKRESIEQKWGLLLRRFQIQNLSDENKIKQTQKFINNIEINNQCCFKPVHAVQRGLKYIQQKKIDKAVQMFRTVQNGQCGKLAQISSLICYGTLLLQQAQRQKNIEKFQKGVLKLQQAVQILKEKRQFQKGLRMIHLSIDSKCVLQLLQNQKQNDLERLSKIVLPNQKKIENSQERAPRQIGRLIDFSEDILFQIIINHHEDVLKSLSTSKIENLVIQFKHLGSLISASPEDQQQFSENVRKIYKEIPQIPHLSVQKSKQLPSFSRQEIFSLAIIQICSGALITLQKQSQQTAETVHKNLISCIQLLFPSQMQPLLKQYFSLSSVYYALVIANAGSSKIEERANKKGDNDFIKYLGTSINEIINYHMRQIKDILGNTNKNIEMIQQEYCSASLWNKLSISRQGKMLISTQNIVNILKLQYFKQIIYDGIRNQRNSSSQEDENKQKLMMNIQKYIQNVVQKCLSKYKSKIANVPIIKSQLQSIIQRQFEQQFQKNKQKMQKQLVTYLKKNSNLSNNIHQNFLHHIKINGIMQNIIGNICKSTEFANALKGAQNNYVMQLRNHIQKLRQMKKRSLNRQFNINHKQGNDTSQQPLLQFNNKEKQSSQYARIIKDQQVTQKILSQKSILDYLIRIECIHEGKVISEKLEKCRSLSMQMKQAIYLSKCNFIPCYKVFYDSLMRKIASTQTIKNIYDIFVKHQISVNNDFCTERLKYFQQALYQNIANST